MATLISDPDCLSPCHVCVKLLDWQKQWEGEKKGGRNVFPRLGALLLFLVPVYIFQFPLKKPHYSAWRQTWRDPTATGLGTPNLFIFFFFFLGKVKSSSSISHIYTSLWKPWSYLTGTAGTDGPELTTQQMTTIGGFTFVCNLHICRTSQRQSRGINLFCERFLAESSDGRDVSPSNWTGLVDLEEETFPGNADGSVCCQWVHVFIMKSCRYVWIIHVIPMLRVGPLVLRVFRVIRDPAANPWTEFRLGRTSGVWSWLRGVSPPACRPHSCWEEGWSEEASTFKSHSIENSPNQRFLTATCVSSLSTN